jgi:hypothetical protein
MKRNIVTLLLISVVLTAHAGNHYIYGQQDRTFHFSGRYLYSDTGEEIGYFENGYLYDSRTGETIGYKSGRYIYSSRDGSLLGYCGGD